MTVIEKMIDPRDERDKLGNLKIGIVMGGYLDENDHLMNRSELNDRLIALQDEVIYQRKLEVEVSKLQSEKAELIEVMKFYADMKSWHTSYFLVVTPTSDSNQIITNDMSIMKGGDGSYEKDVGGKRARAILAKLGVNDGKA